MCIVWIYFLMIACLLQMSTFVGLLYIGVVRVYTIDDYIKER